MPRGRLIFSFQAEIARIDTARTATDPPDGDPSRPVVSGYDPIFREPLKVPANPDDRIGISARRELPPVLVPAQIEAESFERMQMMIGGDSPIALFRIVCHFRDLERMGLVRANGTAAFQKGDRLTRVLQRDGTLVQEFPDPPGLYARQVLPRGFGLSLRNPKRNLLFIDFEAREQSTR